ncbi:hypothetical protein [Priestia megaterium]|uniref:hypothetical protein n=1 Tax=Priestia megaterium TaxID=1404 RepID=UPI003100E1FE
MLRKQGGIQKSDYYDRVDIKIPMVMDKRDKRIEYLHIPEEELIVESIVKPLEEEISIYLRNYFQVSDFPFNNQEKEDIWNHIKFLIPGEMRDYNRVFK